MPDTPPTDTPATPDDTTEDPTVAAFREAVSLLGGIRRTAALLNRHERSVRRMMKGEKPLHDGWTEIISAALIDHADQCRALERQLSPAFAANRTRKAWAWTEDRKPRGGGEAEASDS